MYNNMKLPSTVQTDNMQNHGMFPAPVKSTWLILDTDSFSKLIQLAEKGRLGELSCFVKDALRGKENDEESQPFSQLAIMRSPPVVHAARYGHQHVVEFFTQNFSNIISDGNNRVQSDSTALHEAAHWGHLGVIKFFVDSSISVDCNNCRDGCSPLHSAVIGGSEGAVQYLLTKGADINAANSQGFSPLFEAINTHVQGVYGRDQKWLCDVVQLLLNSGADVCQVADDGRTVLHLIAKANSSTSLQLLKTFLQSNPDSAWKALTTPSKGKKCAELPVLLYAAEWMNKRFIDAVTSHPNCPPGIAADALLALSTTSICPYPIHVVRELLDRALEIMQCAEKQQNPTDLCRYKAEVCRLRTACQLISAAIESGDTIELHYQYLNVRQGVLGPGSRATIQSLWQLGHDVCKKNRFVEAEQLYLKALEMMLLNVTGEYSQPGCYTCHNDLYSILDREFSRLTLREEIVHMIHCNYTPKYDQFVQYGLNITKHLLAKQYLTMDTPHQLLSLLGVWAYGEQKSSKTDTKLVIQQLGRRIVTEESFLTILYLCFGYWEPPYIPASEHDEYISFMIDTTFQWESDSADSAIDAMDCREAGSPTCTPDPINAMDCNGKRPLHVAVTMAPTSHPVCKHTSIEEINVVAMLVDNGAHLDAVDSEGKTAYEICPDPSVWKIIIPPSPPSLICLASRAVVSHGIPYRNLKCLPRCIVSFIMIHDPNTERAPFEHRWWKGY